MVTYIIFATIFINSHPMNTCIASKLEVSCTYFPHPGRPLVQRNINGSCPTIAHRHITISTGLQFDAES
jgi:hypothetical protein